MRSLYMDSVEEYPGKEHYREPLEYLSSDKLYKLSRVEYFQLEGPNYTSDPKLSKLKQSRGYTYEDEMSCSPNLLCDYEQKLRTFYTEHLHTDEEIRLVLEGSGYFDVRDSNDQWIRIHVTPGDLLVILVIPRGIYHRFTLDTNDYIKVKRYFMEEPVWTPHNRPADDMECRKSYLDRMKNNFEE